MFRKSNIYALCNVLLVCILIGITTAINRVPNNNHNSKNRKNLGRNKNFAFSLLEGKSFQFSRNKHYSGRGSKGGSTEEGKKKKGGVFSTAKGLVKPLWDKHKHKLYCAVGKKIGFDGWCKPKNGAPTKPKKPVGKKPPKVVKETYTDESCVACLYILEKVERLVARNPMDGEPSGPNNQNAFPGPASYNPAAYNAAQDVNLASPVPGPGFSSGMFLEVDEKTTSGCPPGMPFCRKPLYRTGRRGVERELARMQKISKQKQVGTDIFDALISTVGSMPPAYHAVIHKLQVRAEQIGVQYVHDYSNEEICVDVGMCFAANLGTAESKVFVSKTRL